jgi:hypothetical protein
MLMDKSKTHQQKVMLFFKVNNAALGANSGGL